MRRLTVLAAALLTSGCVSDPMIRTLDRTSGTLTSQQAAGMLHLGDYLLPQTRITATISSPQAAPAAASTSSTVTNTITVNAAVAPPTPPTPPGQPSGDLADWCRGQRQSYNRNLRAIADANQSWRVLARSNRAERPEFSNDEKAAWKTELTNQITTFETAARAVQNNEDALVNVLPGCPQAIRVQITEAVEADPTRRISLYVASNAAASDSVKLTMDSSGFVTGLSGSSSDRSLEIATGAVKALASVITTFTAPGLPSAALPTADDPCAPVGSPAARAADARALIKDESTIEQAAVTCVLGLLSLRDDLPAIDVPLPFETSLIPSGAPTSTGQSTTTFTFPATLAPLNLTGSISCAVGLQARTESAIAEGLAISTLIPCRALIQRGDNVVAQVSVDVLSSQQTSILPTPRAPFVTNTFAHAFAEGRPTSMEISTPSSLEQGVGFLGNLAGTALSGVTTVFTGRTKDLEARTAFVEADTASIRARNENLALRGGIVEPASEE